MRILPVIIAAFVAVILYGIVFERDALRDVLRGDEPKTAETAAAASETAPESREAEAGTGASGLTKVVVMSSQARDIENTVVLRGRTEADRQVDVMAQTSGLVISEPRHKGSFVDKGDTICEIDPGTLYADLSEAKAKLAEAEISNTAAERLSKGGYASETSAVAAKAALEAASAEVARAEKEIERLTITAPFDGLLETDSAELGSLLQPGALCATLIRLDPIRLVGFLPEISVNAVRTGARAQARLANDVVVEGEVTFVSRSADETTRTFRVDIEVPNPDLALRDGQTAELTIEAAGTTAHLVPPSALTLNDAGEMGLRTVDAENRVAFAPVKIVRDSLDGMYVTGLPDMVDIIVTGQEYVSDGVEVEPHAPEDGA